MKSQPLLMTVLCLAPWLEFPASIHLDPILLLLLLFSHAMHTKVSSVFYPHSLPLHVVMATLC